MNDGLIVAAAAAVCAAASGTSDTLVFLLGAASALYFLGDGFQALQKAQLHLLNCHKQASMLFNAIQVAG